MASETRNIVLGVCYRLWGILRQNGWWTQYTGVTLTPYKGVDDASNEVSPANTYVFADNRHSFVFIDEFNEVSTAGVRVYVGGVLQNPNTYDVDYFNALITLHTSTLAEVTADLQVFSCNVREGYPHDHELELMDLPVIAYQIETDDTQPFVIGSAVQMNRRYFNIFIMARNDGERQDLADDVKKFIRFVPFVDYSSHRPLNETYALDSAFSYADQLVSRLFVLGGVAGTYLEPKPGGSDKERFRALIAFELERLS